MSSNIISSCISLDKLQYLFEYYSRIQELNAYSKIYNFKVTSNQSLLLQYHPTLAVLYHIQTDTPIDEVINLHPEYYL